MPYGPSPRLGLVAPLGSEQINQGDDSLRALIDRLDAVLAPFSFGLMGARPTSSAGSPGIQGRRYRATDAFATFRDTGTGWELESQTPQRVTSLPTGTGIPFDGQEVMIVADATAGTIWRLRYNAASGSPSKWEHIGGPPATAQVATSESLNNVTYGDLTTVGPSFTVPLAGDYLITIGATIAAGGTDLGAMSVQVGATTATDNDRILNQNNVLPLPSSRLLPARSISSGAAITAKYRTGGAQTAFFSNRWLSVTPIRLG